jgi:hypothetical protein
VCSSLFFSFLLFALLCLSPNPTPTPSRPTHQQSDVEITGGRLSDDDEPSGWF